MFGKKIELHFPEKDWKGYFKSKQAMVRLYVLEEQLDFLCKKFGYEIKSEIVNGKPQISQRLKNIDENWEIKKAE